MSADGGANAKKMFILKAGTTYPSILRRHGDFDDWTRRAMGSDDLPLATAVVDVERGGELPPVEECAGVVVTGSHAMVTENLPWSLRVERWLPALVERRVPVLGVCYGHQLLARALGGEVAYHPGGDEIGTVEVGLAPEAADDPLFGGKPRVFPVHVAHSQTVTRLPPGAVRLAANRFEPTHAFRMGRCAWGVQFHPEYDEAVMRAYIEVESAASEERKRALGDAVRETPVAAAIIRGFASFTAGNAV
ncbi:MAG: glutamine amidotransferase [Acidobacteriota bacterium]|jgi:GMP synthase (glutamine-hydrolysing)|nr:glutamine amidotransferase [Acidobacteriota bacterium]